MGERLKQDNATRPRSTALPEGIPDQSLERTFGEFAQPRYQSHERTFTHFAAVVYQLRERTFSELVVGGRAMDCGIAAELGDRGFAI